MWIVGRKSSESFKSVLLGVFLSCVLVGIPTWRIWNSLRDNRFDSLILNVAAENGCDPSLVKAVVWRESKFDPETRGGKGEVGLMQVMPAVVNEWAKAQGEKNFDSRRLVDPLTNLRIGTWYLSRALQQWAHAADPVPLAVAQYNAGRSNVLKWVDPGSMTDGDYFVRSRIQFPATRSYVRDILEQYRLYRRRGEF
jgi:soluble lytic murein transglycosylase